MQPTQNSSDDDYTLRHSADTERSDHITEELTDDPAKELGVSRRELRDGLDKLAGHDPDVPVQDQSEGADDMRETIEDADEDSE